MTKRKRCTYTEEFQQDAAPMLDQNGAGMTEVSRYLGVRVYLLTEWKQQMNEQKLEFTESERLEPARLRVQVKRLRQPRSRNSNRHASSNIGVVFSRTY